MPPNDAARSLLRRTSLPAGPPPQELPMAQHQGPPSGLGLGWGRGSQREAEGEKWRGQAGQEGGRKAAVVN